MAATIPDGGTLTKDPTEVLVYFFDWDTFTPPPIAAGVSIPSGGSTFTITVLDGLNTVPLTKDSEMILTGNRKTRVRLSAGTTGTTYKIDNHITTDETPTQQLDRHFLLKIEDL